MKNEEKDSMKIFEFRRIMTLMDYSAMMHHCFDLNIVIIKQRFSKLLTDNQLIIKNK